MSEIQARADALQAAAEQLAGLPASTAATLASKASASKVDFAQILASATAPPTTTTATPATADAAPTLASTVTPTIAPAATAADPTASAVVPSPDPAPTSVSPVDTAGATAASPVDAGAATPVSYAYPLAVHGEVIGLPYQGSHTLFGNWESDNAVDIAVPTGTPVYAVADGTIGDQIGSLDSTDPHLEGLRVHLVTGDNEFYYAHLSQLVVQPGEHVQKGQLIGYSGEANGVQHLHFACKVGSPVDVLS
jgi:murein DD-endopeptidase MepM/ murein hydrolase activator NlpD